jgi:hypothetical protein
MEALLYLPTAQGVMWGQSDSIRQALVTIAGMSRAARADTVRVDLTLSGDSSQATIHRVLDQTPVFFFEAIEARLPLVARLRDFWYPRLTEMVRPERRPEQPRSDTFVMWGMPQRSLTTIRDHVAVNDPRTNRYVGRAFWRVDRQGYWGAWSDATENCGPCLTLAELIALLNATRGIYAD